MDFIISTYDVDYIIIVKFNNQENKIDLEEVEILTPNEFSTTLINSKYEKINVEKGYLTSQDFSVVDPNNLGDSTNELLNEPKQIEKEDNSQIIRKVNTSGNSSSSKSQKELDKNKLKDDKNDDVKLSVNIKNGNNNSNNSNDNNSSEKNNGEWNTEELNPNEKFHNITQKYYRHLSLKDLTQTKDELKKNEEDLNEKNKKYIFSESQLAINLNNFEGQSIEPIGIVNPSIYCFMICILQTLISIPEVNYYFLSKSYTNKNESDENESDTPICDVYYFL